MTRVPFHMLHSLAHTPRQLNMLHKTRMRDMRRGNPHGHKLPKKQRSGPGFLRRFARFIRGGGD